MSDNVENTETTDNVESTEETTYGIDAIKMVLEAGFKVVKKVEDAKTDDGNVSFWEGAGIAAGSVADIYSIVTNGEQIKNEYNDLDSDERDEIVAWFAEEFDLDNDKAEVIIEAIFDWIVKTDETIRVVLENI